MGLFGSREEIQEVPTGAVVIHENIASVIPDIGGYFLSWLEGPGAEGPLLDEVAAYVNALRDENGWISLDRAGQYIGNSYRGNGPLTFLTRMVMYDSYVTGELWASTGLRGASKRAFKENIERVLREQGHAAAATWAIAARPEAGSLDLDPEFLANQLLSSWGQSVEHVRNIDVIRAFKKWRR